jgi:aryl-alcohol dehydrogenase-like predicted oxidoreductase
MTFGTEWGWGGDAETSRVIFDAFGNAGGNFIDTANRYTEGSSERMLGDFVSSDRSYWVLATKFTLFEKRGDVNGSGNHRKNLRQSLAASLKRLQTDYVDLLWVHAWDFTVQPDELMRSLEDVVRSGQALHIGVSDTPAWIIAQANTLAAMRGWEPFTAVQAEYSLIERSAERELLPMAKAFGLAFTPWAPLAGGALTGKYLQPSAEQKRLSPQSKRVTGRNIDIAAAVVDAARELGWSPAQVALVWCRQREETVVPIAGARKLEQMHDILGAEGKLLPQEIKLKLDEISKIDLGFPHEFLQSDAVKDIISGGTFSKIVH